MDREARKKRRLAREAFDYMMLLGIMGSVSPRKVGAVTDKLPASKRENLQYLKAEDINDWMK